MLEGCSAILLVPCAIHFARCAIGIAQSAIHVPDFPTNSGKGGTGPQKSLTFAEYMGKCVRIFTQIMVIFRIEVMLCQIKGIKKPI